MEEEVKAKQFTFVREITKEDWTIEVNNEDQDTWIVIVLYENHIERSVKLVSIIDQLAKKYPKIKFMKSVATKCIENFLDRDCPGVLIYKGGELQCQHIPAAKDFLGDRMNAKIVEYVLSLIHI